MGSNYQRAWNIQDMSSVNFPDNRANLFVGRGRGCRQIFYDYEEGVLEPFAKAGKLHVP